MLECARRNILPIQGNEEKYFRKYLHLDVLPPNNFIKEY